MARIMGLERKQAPLAIAFENFRARFNRTLQIESDELFCPLTQFKPKPAAG